MSEQKICPLLTIANIGTEHSICFCQEENCAWWIGSECAMLCVAETPGSMDSEIVVYEGD